MDLTGDSVTPETLAEGETAHSANGERITGTMQYKTFYVTIQGADGVYTADKTFAEIIEAYNNGRTIFANVSFSEGNYGAEGLLLPILMCIGTEGVLFGGVADNTNINAICTPDGIMVMAQSIPNSEEVDSKWIDNSNVTYYVKDNGSTTAGTWVAKCDNVTTLFDGLSVNYKITIAGVSTGTTFNLNGLGAKPIYLRGTTVLTTHFAVDTMINLIYNASTGAWYCSDYDANTKNSAGTSNKTGTKMYLVGGTSQNSSGVTTYSNSGVYIGTDNELYSNGKKVLTTIDIPEKGVDYFTEADKEEIVQAVITALGTPVFGRVDENNNIILTGELANGTYTLKYEDSDGTLTEIGILDMGEDIVLGNIPITWIKNIKIDKNTGAETTDSQKQYCTNEMIELDPNGTYAMTVTNWFSGDLGINYCYYGESGNFLGYVASGNKETETLTPPSGARGLKLRVWVGSGGNFQDQYLACISIARTA